MATPYNDVRNAICVCKPLRAILTAYYGLLAMVGLIASIKALEALKIVLALPCVFVLCLPCKVDNGRRELL